MSAPLRNLADLLAGLAMPPPDLAGLVPTGLRLDSRAIEPGEAFVALAGQQRHGLDFAAAAAERGASCVLFEPPAPAAVHSAPPLPALAVPALRRHLGLIADRAYGSPSRQLTVVGVTGTNGKTSTVHLLAQALAGAGTDVATIGTLGSGRPGALVDGERTTPDVLSVHALLRRFVDAGISHVAMEVSSHALDQGRVDQVAFAVAVFSNLSRDHLDYHGDMQAYGAAKARLFDSPGLAAAVVNSDDAFGRELARTLRPSLRRLRFGLLPLADGGLPEFHAADVRTGSDGLGFTLVTPDGAAPVASALLGRFNVGNLLGVAAVLHALDWSLPAIAGALADLRGVPGRMQHHGGGDKPLVVVDYAHTPDALEQALASLRDHTAGRLICLFGCGGERDAGKRPQMAAIAQRLADAVIVTDDNPRGEDGDVIVADILAGFDDPAAITVERDRARAIAAGVAAATPGDIVLVAGKGHEPYQEIGGRRLPFDDSAHVLAALRARPC
jgi:UDP-N-acetylmuramoyl-L-alanyl-D-glutamate--2,6-diaminopimelate ligase